MDPLEEIAEEIRKCRKCPLWKYRTNAVPGEGDPTSGIMFIGEAPGREEDKQGRPFVGAAGKLLTHLIESILGISRKNVFITNVLKCRPPNNRDPRPEEIEACGPYLRRQIEIIKPRVIVCLGRFSAEFVFDYFRIPFTTISKVRGKIFWVKKWDKDVAIIPTYHPAAALYHPQWRTYLEDDFRKIAEILRGDLKKRSSLLDFF